MKTFRKLLFLIFLLPLFSSCNFLITAIDSFLARNTLIVTPEKTDIYRGETVHYRAELLTKDGGRIDVTDTAIWSLSDPLIGNITYKGELTAIRPGTGSVAATYESVSGYASLDVRLPATDPATWTILNSNINKYEYCYNNFIAGNYLYYITVDLLYTGPSLHIYDISSPLSPKWKSTFVLPATDAVDIFVSGNYAYIASPANGLIILDISNKSIPQYVSAIPSIPAFCVNVTGTFAYAGDVSTNTFYVIDVSIPAGAGIIGSAVLSGPALNMVVKGNFAYVATETTLDIVDISAPSLPSVVKSITASITGTDVGVYGNYAYFVDHDAYLIHIINIANPASAYFEKSISVTGCGITISGNKGYVAGGNTFTILTFSDPLNPIIETVSTLPDTVFTSLYGNYAFVTACENGMFIFDINTFSSAYMTVAGDLVIPNCGRNIAISGNYGYVADLKGGLQIIGDITIPAESRVIRAVRIPHKAENVVVHGSYAYVVGQTETGYPAVSDLQIVDISVPEQAHIVGSCAVSGTCSGIDAEGNHVYLGANNQGLYIIDVSNPANPLQIGFASTGTGPLYDVEVQGDYAYLSSYTTGFRVINIKNPYSPSLLYTIDTPGTAHGIGVKGNFCIVADLSSGMEIYDISGLPSSSPSLVGSYGCSAAVDIVFRDNYAFLADAGSGIIIFDVSALPLYSYIKTIAIPSGAESIALNPSFGYVTAGSDGLIIIGQ